VTRPQKYSKRPISEAVVEYRFVEPIKEATLEKLVLELKAAYPKHQRTFAIDLNLQADQVSLLQKPDGYKLFAADDLGIVSLSPMALSISRLAPYEGWEAFHEVLKYVWKRAEKLLTFRGINRVGMRYINRLDIPTGNVVLNEWLNIAFTTPNTTGSMTEFTLRTVARNGPEGSIITVASTQPVIIGHSSIILDIDVFREGEMPTRETEFWDQLIEFRNKKNSLFEASITEKTRELIA
jgi:uncharacterized protein (TIGR04255 family)